MYGSPERRAGPRGRRRHVVGWSIIVVGASGGGPVLLDDQRASMAARLAVSPPRQHSASTVGASPPPSHPRRASVSVACSASPRTRLLHGGSPVFRRDGIAVASPADGFGDYFSAAGASRAGTHPALVGVAASRAVPERTGARGRGLPEDAAVPPRSSQRTSRSEPPAAPRRRAGDIVAGIRRRRRPGVGGVRRQRGRRDHEPSPAIGACGSCVW